MSAQQESAAGLLPTAAQEQEDPRFWSIERFVAFILAPILTAASGYAAILISTKLPGHPKVSGGAVYAFASTMALAVAGVIAKWLHGRQVVLPKQKLLEAQLTPLLSGLDTIPGGHQMIVKLLAGVQDEAQTVSAGVAAGIDQRTQELVQEAPKRPPPQADIPPAEFDPAPATPVSGEAAAASSVG